MVASRSRVIRAFCPARFWLSAFCAGLMPTSIGYQDLAALIAHGHDRGGASAWHLIASPFGTVEAATFSYSRPIGSAIPEPLGLFQNVNFDPRSLDAYAWKVDEPLIAPSVRQVEYPSVDRSHKGDRLPAASVTPSEPDPSSLPQLQPISAPVPLPATQPAPLPEKTDRRVEAPDVVTAPPVAAATAAMDSHDETASLPPSASGGVAAVAAADEETAIADKPPELPAPGESDTNNSRLDELSFMDDDADHRSTQVYFRRRHHGLAGQSGAMGAGRRTDPDTTTRQRRPIIGAGRRRQRCRLGRHRRRQGTTAGSKVRRIVSVFPASRAR